MRGFLVALSAVCWMVGGLSGCGTDPTSDEAADEPTVQAAPAPPPEPEAPVEPPEPSCDEQCLSGGQVMYEQCTASGGDSESCRRAASEQEQACLTRTCAKPAGGDCANTCKAEAETDHKTCVDEGNPTTLCTTLADAKQAACVAACGDG